MLEHIRDERGELTIRMFFGVLVLCVAYLMDPGAFNGFFHYVLTQFFGHVHQAFDTHTQTTTTMHQH